MLLVGWLEAASRRASRSENDSAAGRAGLKPPPDAARRSCQWPRWRRCWSRDPGLPLRRSYWPRWLPCLPIAGSTWMPAKRGQDAPDGATGVQGSNYSKGCCSAGRLKVASNGSQPFVVNGPLASVPVAMLLNDCAGAQNGLAGGSAGRDAPGERDDSRDASGPLPRVVDPSTWRRRLEGISTWC